MPRYFFHSVDGRLDVDEEGTDFPDLAAARIGAIRYAGDVLSSEPDVLWDGHEFRVQVTNEEGAVVVTIVTLAVDSAAVALPEDAPSAAG